MQVKFLLKGKHTLKTPESEWSVGIKLFTFILKDFSRDSEFFIAFQILRRTQTSSKMNFMLRHSNRAAIGIDFDSGQSPAGDFGFKETSSHSQTRWLAVSRIYASITRNTESQESWAQTHTLSAVFYASSCQPRTHATTHENENRRHRSASLPSLPEKNSSSSMHLCWFPVCLVMIHVHSFLRGVIIVISFREVWKKAIHPVCVS